MATNDELSSQLKLTQNLADVIDKMAASATKLQQSYETQTVTLEKLAKVMGTLNLQQAGQSYEQLNTALKKSQEAGDSTAESLKKLVKQTLLADKETKSLGDQVGKTVKKVTLAAAAWSGLNQGFKNLLAIGKGMGGLFETISGGLFDIGAAIVAIPIKILSGLVDMAAKSANGMNELMQAIENVRKEFGDLKGPGAGAILQTNKTLKGFSDTGLSAWRVFGTLAERLETVLKVAKAMGPTFSVLEKEFRDNGGAILGFQKGLGISDEEMKGLGMRAITMGKPLSKVLLETAKQTLELGNAFEIDQKLIGKDMAKASQDVKHFGQMTVKEIGQASVYARKLGLELDKIVGTLDAFETFDTAAENAAKLSQSFGVTVDAFKMMEAQSPAEQLEMLRKEFKGANVDSSQFNRQQLKLLASTTGLDEATAKQAFSLNNQGLSLDAIKKKSEGAEKKTLTQAEAMSKLADSIERMVKSGHLTGSFFDMFVKGILAGIQNTKEFWKIMTNIQIGLQTVYYEGMRLGKAFVEIFPGVKTLLGGIADFFDPRKFKALAGGVTNVFIQFFKDLSTGRWSFSELMDKLKKTFFDFFDKEMPAGRQMIEGFKTMMKTVAKVLAEGIKWLADQVANGLKFVAEFIRDPSKFLKGAGGAAGGALGFLGEILLPIADALKHAWVVLWPALKEVFSVVAHKLWEFLKSDEFLSIIKPAIPTMAAILFGPALSRAVLATIVNSVGTAAFKGLAEVGKKLTGAGKATESVAGVAKGGGAAIESAKGWGAREATQLGTKLLALSLALAVGGVAIAGSVWLIKKILGNMTLKEAEVPLAMLAAIAIGSIPLMFALKLAKNLGDPADIAIGGLVITAAVTIVGAVGALLAYILKKTATPAELEAAGGFMLKMSLVFLAMVPLIGAAMVLGSIVTASSGLALVPIAAGMAVIASATSSMMDTAMKIVEQLAKLHIEAGFQTKVDAFLGIMKSIQAFADTLVKLISMMTPSFTDLLTGKSEKFSEKVLAANTLLATMIGTKGSGKGIIGIVELVVDSIKNLSASSPEIVKSAEIFGGVLSAVSAAMKAMTPPDAFFVAGDSLMSHLNGPKPFADLASDVEFFAQKMRIQLFKLLTGDASGNIGDGKGGLIPMIKKMAEIAATMPGSDKIGLVTNLMGSLVSVLEAITPKPELVQAFSKTASTSLFSVAGADVMKTAGSKVDTKAFADFISTMQTQFTTMLPLLTGGTLKALIKAADDPSLSPDKLAKVTDISNALKSVTEFSKNVNEKFSETLKGFALLPNLTADVKSALDEKGIANIVSTVGRMIAARNALSAALSDIKPINVAAKLAPIAAGLGLGAKGEYEIKTKDVVVQVNLQVTMDTTMLEQQMVLRGNSIVRQRLDALSENAGMGPKIGGNYTQSAGGPPALSKGSQ